MIKRELIVLFLILGFANYLKAQKSGLSLKTNLLSWAVLAPNLQLECDFSRHYSISFGGGYGWWGFEGQQNALQSWTLAGSFDFYPDSEYSYTKHHIGIDVRGGQFDIKWGKTGRRGEYFTAGFLYGYTWHIRSSFFIDAGLGVGYIHSDYTKYRWYSPSNCFYSLEHVSKNVPGITQLKISLIYRFPKHKK